MITMIIMILFIEVCRATASIRVACSVFLFWFSGGCSLIRTIARKHSVNELSEIPDDRRGISLDAGTPGTRSAHGTFLNFRDRGY